VSKPPRKRDPIAETQFIVPDDVGRFLARKIREGRHRAGRVKDTVIAPRFGRPTRSSAFKSGDKKP
jgi:hypothetical protein